MKKKREIIYIADYLSSVNPGGAELNDRVLIKSLYDMGHRINAAQSRGFFGSIIEECRQKNAFLIISNFWEMPPESIEQVQASFDYVIYEHDHKYIKGRNPIKYKNFKAPDSDIINKDFYLCAKKIFCQSSFHESIVRKNLGEKIKTYNISGNLWSNENYDYMKKMSLKKKSKRYSILKSSIGHKNTYGAIQYCEKRGIEYDLIESSDYLSFLDQISNNETLLFLPHSPETLSRIVVESRMMGMKVITNKLVGAQYEKWFSSKGNELIDIMSEKNKEVLNELQKSF